MYLNRANLSCFLKTGKKKTDVFNGFCSVVKGHFVKTDVIFFYSFVNFRLINKRRHSVLVAKSNMCECVFDLLTCV